MNIHSKISKAVKVSKWGNSLAVRLPADLVRRLGLKEGEEVEISINENDAGAGGLALSRKASSEELLAEILSFNRSAPEDYVFDREEAHERNYLW
jgi:antitoxin MazE